MTCVCTNNSSKLIIPSLWHRRAEYAQDHELVQPEHVIMMVALSTRSTAQMVVLTSVGGGLEARVGTAPKLPSNPPMLRYGGAMAERSHR